jgi:hypothetical protein
MLKSVLNTHRNKLKVVTGLCTGVHGTLEGAAIEGGLRALKAHER